MREKAVKRGITHRGKARPQREDSPIEEGLTNRGRTHPQRGDSPTERGLIHGRESHPLRGEPAAQGERHPPGKETPAKEETGPLRGNDVH